MSLSRRIIAIAGAGLAGMTAALFLQRAGFRVLLFEKAEKVPQSGTGIQISPNAYKVLDQLGLTRSLAMIGFAPDRIEIGAGHSGKHLANFELGDSIRQRHGAPYLVVHRVDLAQILHSACEAQEDIEILHGLQVSDLAAHPNGLTLLCEARGSVSEYLVSAIIGADGAWSSMRSFVHDSIAPEFTGLIAWRVMMDIESVAPAISRQSTGLWLGPRAHLVHYPVRQGRLLNVIAITRWEKEYAPDKGWMEQAITDERVAPFVRWQPHLRELVNTRSNWGGWPIFACKKPGKFANGPLCLIGDAAHAMVPFGAQGGASAIEDAMVMAAECSRTPDDLPAAFQRFETQRHRRVQNVMSLSRNNQSLYHMSAPLSWGRNAVMKAAKQDRLQRRMDWLYGWEPPST